MYINLYYKENIGVNSGEKIFNTQEEAYKSLMKVPSIIYIGTFEILRAEIAHSLINYNK